MKSYFVAFLFLSREQKFRKVADFEVLLTLINLLNDSKITPARPFKN